MRQEQPGRFRPERFLGLLLLFCRCSRTSSLAIGAINNHHDDPYLSSLSDDLKPHYKVTEQSRRFSVEATHEVLKPKKARNNEMEQLLRRHRHRLLLDLTNPDGPGGDPPYRPPGAVSNDGEDDEAKIDFEPATPTPTIAPGAVTEIPSTTTSTRVSPGGTTTEAPIATVSAAPTTAAASPVSSRPVIVTTSPGPKTTGPPSPANEAPGTDATVVLSPAPAAATTTPTTTPELATIVPTSTPSGYDEEASSGTTASTLPTATQTATAAVEDARKDDDGEASGAAGFFAADFIVLTGAAWASALALSSPAYLW